jgi:hypothetical protein
MRVPIRRVAAISGEMGYAAFLVRDFFPDGTSELVAAGTVERDIGLLEYSFELPLPFEEIHLGPVIEAEFGSVPIQIAKEVP